MARATPTAAMNAASATSTTGAAFGFLPMGDTMSVGRGFGRAPRVGSPRAGSPRAGSAASTAGGSNGFRRARGGGARCSVVRASSGGGTGSNGLRRLRFDGDDAIGVGTLLGGDGLPGGAAPFAVGTLDGGEGFVGVGTGASGNTVR